MPISNVIITQNGKSEDPKAVTEIANSAWSLENKEKDILIWIHGAFITQEEAQRTADIRAQLLADKPVFPIDFAWHSGITEQLPDILDHIVARRLGSGILDLVEKYIAGRLSFQPAGAAAAALPQATYDLTETDRALLNEAVKRSPDLMAEEAHLGRKLTGLAAMAPLTVAEFEADPATMSDLDKRILEVAGKEDGHAAMAVNPLTWLTVAKVVFQVASAVLDRYRRGRERRQIRATILEELVSLLGVFGDGWEALKKDAEAHFTPGGAGLELLNALKESWPDENKRRVIVAGHSTGAVFLNAMVREASVPGGFHLRYLAAASRVDVTAKSLNRDKVASAWLVSLRESVESTEALLGMLPDKFKVFRDVYPGSILYIVSACCEGKPDVAVLGLDCFMSKSIRLTDEEAQQVEAVHHVIDTVILSPTTDNEHQKYKCLATTHVGISSDVDALMSIIS